MNRKLLYLQSAFLLGGTVFSWTTLIINFRKFYSIYGTFFKFQGCVIPNPLATPCFYGALAFVAALIWARSLILEKEPKASSQLWLSRFLLFGVVFALSVLSYEAVEYYHIFSGPSISCSPGLPPWKTSCFYGALFFVLSYVTSLFVNKSKTQSQIAQV